MKIYRCEGFNRKVEVATASDMRAVRIFIAEQTDDPFYRTWTMDGWTFFDCGRNTYCVEASE